MGALVSRRLQWCPRKHIRTVNTAWDSNHPYYDAKTDKDNPKWFMVEVTISSRAKNFIPLALLRHIATSAEAPEEVSYIGEAGIKAIKAMALVNRGRLSVQRVNDEAWSIIEQMAENGGWDEMNFGKGKAGKDAVKVSKDAREKSAKAPKAKDASQGGVDAGSPEPNTRLKRKAVDKDSDPPPRRSRRTKA
ncbi:hypothetical protein HWV62_9097 [Athelia sp. TMB]|nr:hypothetical protein HWV62_9097 [Athelia sp. TMB]